MTENDPPEKGKGLDGSDTAKALNHSSPCRSDRQKRPATAEIASGTTPVKTDGSIRGENIGDLVIEVLR